MHFSQHVNGWTSVEVTENPHAVLGCITTGLCFIQPFLAMLRCAPDHRNRPIFNWIHWLVGNAAQVRYKRDFFVCAR